MNEKVIMKCPQCKNIVEISSEFKPFCSKTCKNLDFLNWANEEKSIPMPDDSTSD